MNIFILDTSPSRAAQLMHLTHLGHKHTGTWGCPKMALEGLQMLAGAFHAWGWRPVRRLDGNPYSPHQHPYHRCSQWVKASHDHALWLALHIEAMLNRYKTLAGKPASIFESFNDARHTLLDLGTFTVYRPEYFVVADGIQATTDRFAPDKAVALYRAYYAQKFPDWEAERIAP